MPVRTVLQRRLGAGLAGALAALLALAPFAAAAPATTQFISTDPYTNTSSQHQTQVEPDTFAFGSTIVAAFQSGRFTDGGASNVGWATSTDSGATWTNGFLPGTTVYATPPGPYDRATDPSVAFDARHNVWMISTLGMTGTSGAAVIVNRSTDGGLTWGNPVTVSTSGGGFYDNPWIVCDNTATSPFYGNCYTEWDDFSLGDREFMSTSSDGGLTWGARKSPSGGGTGIGGTPLVQPNGTVIVPLADAFESSIQVFASRNGGGSWTRTRRIASISHHTVAGGLREGPLPSAEIDGSGKIYVVWADCRFETSCSANDIVMTTSTDGRTWTPVARIPIDPVGSNVDHFLPGIAVNPTTSGATAHLALTYYYYPAANCTFSTCQLTVGFISSTDGGATWGGKQTVGGPMSLNDIANTTQGRMVGDYISTSYASNGTATGVFEVGNPKSGTTFHEDTYAATNSAVPYAGPGLPVEYGPVLSTESDHAPLTTPVVLP